MDPRLEDLARRCRARGMRVGPDELGRLATVVAAIAGSGGEAVTVASAHDLETLGLALAAVVAKSGEEAALFAEIFDGWARVSLRVQADEPGPEPKPSLRPEPPRPPAVPPDLRGPRRWALAAALATIALTTLLHRPVTPPAVEPGSADTATSADTGSAATTDLADTGISVDPTASPDTLGTGTHDTGASLPTPDVATIEVWVPYFSDPVPVEPAIRWDARMLAVAAFLALFGSIQYLLRRREQPVIAPGDPGSTPRRVGAVRATLLLDPADQDALGWGLAQHTAEEPTRQLDLPRTVQATADAAGLPELRFETRHARKGAWIWFDRPGTRLSRRYADELVEALDGQGLPVRRSDIAGLPSVLADEAGETSLFDVDTAERAARVLVLTDGARWADAIDHDPPGGPAEQVLDELRTWAHLTVVDLGEPPSLAARLAPWGIPVVRPEEAATALAGEPARKQDAHDLALWEAACALGGGVTGDRALRLRAELGLGVSPWHVAALFGGRAPDLAERARALRRLDAAVGYTRPGPLPTVLTGILGAWRRLTDDPVLVATLSLWDEPVAAIRALLALERAAVRAAVGGLVPADARAEGVRLPWTLDRLDPRMYAALGEIGLGAEVGWAPPTELRQPARRIVGFAALVGVILTAGVVGTHVEELPRVRLEENGRPGEEGVQANCEDLGSDGWRCEATSPSEEAVAQGLDEGPISVALTWAYEQKPCVDEWVIRCDKGRRPPRPDGRPPVSVVRFTDRQDVDGRALAALLLQGTADAVQFSFRAGLRIGRGSFATRDRKELGPDRQEIRITSEETDLKRLAAAIDFTGAKRGSELDGWKDLPGAESFIVFGVPRCGNERLDEGEDCDASVAGTTGCSAECSWQERPEGCGNGVTEGAEECDGGDRCSSRCEWKAQIQWPKQPITWFEIELPEAPWPATLSDEGVFGEDTWFVIDDKQRGRGGQLRTSQVRRHRVEILRQNDGVAPVRLVESATRQGGGDGAPMRAVRLVEGSTPPDSSPYLGWFTVNGPARLISACGNAKKEGQEECDGEPDCDQNCGWYPITLIETTHLLTTATTEITKHSTKVRLDWTTIPLGKGVVGPDDFHDRWTVTFTRPFEMLKTEVTWAQYRGVTGAEDDSLPASVSWLEASNWCKTYHWRLPTEVEWEYASRAETETEWSFGNDGQQLADYAWYNKNSQSAAHTVGTRQPNAWGLYDIYGNLWEWVADVYEPGAWGQYAEGGRDPSIPIDGPLDAYHVVRGGGFQTDASGTRSAVRLSWSPNVRDPSIGFRCVRDLP